jgi:hypothetical protein
VKNVLYPLISILVVATVTLCFLLLNEKTKTEQLLNTLKQSADEKEDLTVERKYREAEFFLNGKEISKEFVISDGKGNRIEWHEIMDDKNKLVLFFSESACDMCVNFEIDRLNDKVDLIVSDNTVILIYASNNRYITQYKNNNKFKYPVYEIKTIKDDHSLPSVPLYFIIEKKSGRINSAFFPSKYNPSQTGKYLNNIMENYF